jgi:hypothetical protein
MISKIELVPLDRYRMTGVIWAIMIKVILWVDLTWQYDQNKASLILFVHLVYRRAWGISDVDSD